MTSRRSSPVHSKRSSSKASSASGSAGVSIRAIGDRVPSHGVLLDCVPMKRRIAVDLSVLRESRNLRLLVIGELFSGLGSQAALVAIPFQIYMLTHSPALVGLLGIVELVPIVVGSLFGGAIADRVERRQLMLVAQTAIAASRRPRWRRSRSPATRRCG